MESFDGLWFDHEDKDTQTSTEQCNCEKECSNFLAPFTSTYTRQQLNKFREGGLINSDNEIRLLRRLHAIYLTNGLNSLSSGFVSLDSSRPWICYWITHALYLLESEPEFMYTRIIATLEKMQVFTGGFGGGPHQLPHTAPNYAAILTLCTIGKVEGYSIINRENMYRFFMSVKDPCGGFRMHHDGEIDTRGTYTVLAIARILNILTPQLTEGVTEYLLSCQTYEGGFGGEPYNEAHGGYNFCALAALLILGCGNSCRLDAQENWLLHRQMKFEGGFQGRTNKLVDSCYSFWQGAALAVLNIIRAGGDDLYDMKLYMSHKEQQTQTQSQQVDGRTLPLSEYTTPSSTSAGKKSSAPTTSDIHDTQGEDTVVELTESDRQTEVQDDNGELQFNQRALQRYILHCGQTFDGSGGGMRGE